jgi:hypothetical protein
VWVGGKWMGGTERVELSGGWATTDLARIGSFLRLGREGEFRWTP